MNSFNWFLKLFVLTLTYKYFDKIKDTISLID